MAIPFGTVVLNVYVHVYVLQYGNMEYGNMAIVHVYSTRVPSYTLASKTYRLWCHSVVNRFQTVVLYAIAS